MWRWIHFWSLCNQGYFDDLSVKHIILNLANCLELLIKFKLESEHWTLVFADLNKARYSNYLDGNFVSADIKSGISRLKNVCEIEYPFIASTRIYQYRNYSGFTKRSTKDFKNSIENYRNYAKALNEF